MTNPPMVCAVILNWNGLPYVITCLEKVLASHYPDLSVIVVDNGSTDGSVAAIADQFPDILLLRTATNLGYAAGNNLGIQKALALGADFILALNNDTEIKPDMVTHLVAALEENHQAGIAAPKIFLLDAPEQLWAVGGVFESRRVQTLGINEPDLAQFEDVELDFVFGCSMLIRREVFERIGLFDTSFRFYFEDIDLCIRAKQAGFAVIWVPHAQMWHKSPLETQSSSNFKIYHYERSRILFYCKHLRRRERLWFVLTQLPHILASAWRHTHRGRNPTAWWYVTRAVIGALPSCGGLRPAQRIRNR